jgi:hypothetical protein
VSGIAPGPFSRIAFAMTTATQAIDVISASNQVCDGTDEVQPATDSDEVCVENGDGTVPR